MGNVGPGAPGRSVLLLRRREDPERPGKPWPVSRRIRPTIPSPDLAVEIDVSGPQIDRPAIYADLGVAEVWRLGRANFIIEQLQADGSYASVETSRFLGNLRRGDPWLALGR